MKKFSHKFSRAELIDFGRLITNFLNQQSQTEFALMEFLHAYNLMQMQVKFHRKFFTTQKTITMQFDLNEALAILFLNESFFDVQLREVAASLHKQMHQDYSQLFR